MDGLWSILVVKFTVSSWLSFSGTRLLRSWATSRSAKTSVSLNVGLDITLLKGSSTLGLFHLDGFSNVPDEYPGT